MKPLRQVAAGGEGEAALQSEDQVVEPDQGRERAEEGEGGGGLVVDDD